MRIAIASLIVCLFVFQDVAQVRAKAQKQSMAFAHVAVLDMRGGLAMPGRTVGVEGNRITAVEKSSKARLPKADFKAVRPANE